MRAEPSLSPQLNLSLLCAGLRAAQHSCMQFALLFNSHRWNLATFHRILIACRSNSLVFDRLPTLQMIILLFTVCSVCQQRHADSSMVVLCLLVLFEEPLNCAQNHCSDCQAFVFSFIGSVRSAITLAFEQWLLQQRMNRRLFLFAKCWRSSGIKVVLDDLKTNHATCDDVH